MANFHAVNDCVAWKGVFGVSEDLFAHRIVGNISFELDLITLAPRSPGIRGHIGWYNLLSGQFDTGGQIALDGALHPFVTL